MKQYLENGTALLNLRAASPGWRTWATYNNVSTFYNEASIVAAGQATVSQGQWTPPIGGAFITDYVRAKLDKTLRDINTDFHSKAAKGRPTNLEVATTTLRSYVVLTTGPTNQVISWSWWIDPEKGRLWDVAHTFSD